MKAKLTQSNGSVVEFEGTPEEIKQVLEGPAPRHPVHDPLPIDWSRRLREAYQKLSPGGREDSIPAPFYTECYACNGRPWFGVNPPEHTCGMQANQIAMGGSTPGKGNFTTWLNVNTQTPSWSYSINNVPPGQLRWFTNTDNRFGMLIDSNPGAESKGE